MLRITTLVHQHPQLIISEEPQPPIATSMGRQPGRPPRRRTISVGQQLRTKIAMAIPSARQHPQLITLVTPQPPIVTDMGTQ